MKRSPAPLLPAPAALLLLLLALPGAPLPAEPNDNTPAADTPTPNTPTGAAQGQPPRELPNPPPARPLPTQPGPSRTLSVLSRADAAYERRAEGHRGGRAAPGPIGEAIDLYAAELRNLADEPDGGGLSQDLKVRSRLLAALYFKGELVDPFTEDGNDARQETFDRGRQVFESGLDRLAGLVGGRERLDALSAEETAAVLRKALSAKGGTVNEVVPLYYWGSVSWGLWGDAFGKVAAVRQGVAGKLRHYMQVLLVLDPSYLHAGPRRIWGRFHSEAPRIPFFTSWIDRDIALRELAIAWKQAPEEPLNGLYLAEALLAHAPSVRHAEALRILRTLTEREPRADYLVEDKAAIEKARRRLEEAG